jgi:DNA-binding response OmpR family regulator
MLPGAPGTEVFQNLRERSDVPVIMLGVRDSAVDKAAVGLELGADEVSSTLNNPETCASNLHQPHYR